MNQESTLITGHTTISDALLRLLAATLAPLAPLSLTMMPLEELLKKLIGILL